jgi:aminoglycoside phosphotransferase (APT) family kinase protein
MQTHRRIPLASAIVPRRWSARWQSRSLVQPGCSANLASARDVARILLRYFKTRLGVRSLAFAKAPIACTGGWETYTYHFQLKSPELQESPFAQPLTVRIYSGPPGLPRAQREFQVQRHMWERNYPVAEPFLVEEEKDYFGGPFLVMTRVLGTTLLRALLRRPRRLLWAPAQMAEAHVRLHRLPTADFPALPGCSRDCRVDEMRTLIEEYGLRSLRSGWDWLCTNRPPWPADPCIVHLDFHPLNLIMERSGSLVVLDWNEADLGDPHADVGTTLTLMDCPPAVSVSWMEKLSIRMGRAYFSYGYLRAYRQQMPLVEDRLAYYRAFAAFRRLCFYGRWLQGGPQITGHKPSLLQCITDTHRHCLEEYFRKWTGVRVRL